MGSNIQDTSINSTNAGSSSNNQQNESAPLYSTSQDNKNLRIIIFLFSTVTAVVSIVLFFQMKYGDYQVIPHGSVASDHERCSLIGAGLIQTGGNAVDAAIAAAFCISVVSPHLTGIGGSSIVSKISTREWYLSQQNAMNEFNPAIFPQIEQLICAVGFTAGVERIFSTFGIVQSKLRNSLGLQKAAKLVFFYKVFNGTGGLMLIYNHRQGQVLDSIDFRVQKAPINDAVGVPGFVAGLWTAHSLYGTLPWSKLLEPSIHLARDGYPVTRGLMDSKQHVLPNMTHNLALKSWLSGLVDNESIVNQDLARTLQLISDQGGDVFYNTTLATTLSPWLPPRSIASYQARRTPAVRTKYQGYNILASGAGSGGPYLIDSLPRISYSSPSLVMSLAKAFSENQLDAWPVMSGTSLSATDTNDVFVSIVSGLGSILGAQFLTTGGYLLNNAVENIASTSEGLRDGQFVPTLSTPIVITQAAAVCGRRFVFGTGDVRDGLQTVLSLLRNTNQSFVQLNNNPNSNLSPSSNNDPNNIMNPENNEPFPATRFASSEDRLLAESIESPRVRILGPHIARETEHPAQLPAQELLALQNVFNLDIAAPLPYPSANVIEKISDSLHAYADSRGGGGAVMF